MKEIVVRATTGAIYVALTIAAVWAGPFTTALLFFPVCLLAAGEMHDLYWPAGKAPPKYWSVLVAGAFYVGVVLHPWFGHSNMELIITLCFILLLISMAWIFWLAPADPANFIGGLLVVMLLVGAPFALLPHFHQFGKGGNGHEVLMGFFLLLWVNETGAYLAGRAFGRHKLSPTISPKKTIEGLMGGIIVTVGSAWLIASWWNALSLRQWLVSAALVATISTLGDLFESAMKRSRGVKDSGNLLPGHGGILDRFDGFLLAAPAMFIYLLLTT